MDDIGYAVSPLDDVMTYRRQQDSIPSFRALRRGLVFNILTVKGLVSGYLASS